MITKPAITNARALSAARRQGSSKPADVAKESEVGGRFANAEVEGAATVGWNCRTPARATNAAIR